MARNKWNGQARWLGVSGTASYQQTFAYVEFLCEFAKREIIPQLDRVTDGRRGVSKSELALVGTYYRMYAWMQSGRLLREPVHFQAAAAGARSLFELLLDMKILAEDPTGEWVQRFHAFPDAAKFQAADKLLAFYDEDPNVEQLDVSAQRCFVDLPGKRETIYETVRNYWGTKKNGEPNFPVHWSGKNLRERAHQLGPEWEKRYLELYSQLNWYVHPGSVGYAGLSLAGIGACLGWSLSIGAKMFLDATKICAECLQISRALQLLDSPPEVLLSLWEADQE